MYLVLKSLPSLTFCALPVWSWRAASCRALSSTAWMNRSYDSSKMNSSVIRNGIATIANSTVVLARVSYDRTWVMAD